MRPQATLPPRRSRHVSSGIFLTTFLFPLTALAQTTGNDSIELPPLVISATRLPTPENELGSSVTVITGDDIARKQMRTLPDVLLDVPGLNIVQTGSPGGTTSVFIRGTNANHTKVFIDGVDVSDPSSVDGSFDLSQILTADIERVEVLRGPQSGLYGSDAIGGVINIITRKGSGPPTIRASIEGGSYDTFNQTAGASGSQARFDYSFDFAHFYSGSTPVTPVNLVPTGRPVNNDSYDNKTYSTRLGAGITDNFDVGVVARYVTTALSSTFDDFIGPEAIPTDSDNREFVTRGFAHLVSFGGIFDQTFGVGYTYYRRRFFDPNDPSAGASYFRGDRVKIDWLGNIKIDTGSTLSLGLEHQLDEINDSPPVNASISNNAGFVQLQSNFADRFFNAVSLRYDDNQSFGGQFTYRVAPALLFPETGTRIKGSVGTGFKAPSLDQLFDSFPQFGFFANPNLKPETSFGYDLGFEQDLLAKRLALGATFFHNNIKNLITFNDSFTSYINIGRATTYGVEAFAAYHPLDTVALRIDYTYTYAKDDILDEPLLRRPTNKVSLNGAWHVTDAATVSGTLVYVGPWFDVNRAGTASGIKASGYTIINLASSYDLGHGFAAFGRINNLLNQRFQDPLGFQHQGLAVIAGIRVALDTNDWKK